MQCNTAGDATREERQVAEWGCDEYQECPCGCGWAVCSVFGEFIDHTDCWGCEYNERDNDEEGEEDAGSGD